MNNRFDELTKNIAQTVTRRAAMKKLGVGLAGMALACFGLANKAEAGSRCWPRGTRCYLSGGGKSCSRCCNGWAISWNEVYCQ